MRRIWGGGGAGGLSVNDVLMKDARLSVPARGLAVHLLLLPDSSPPDLVRLASRPGESKESIEGYLEELEEVGYLRRRLVYARSGRAFEEVTVYARADAGDEAADVRGRVFHWPATPERERRLAEADARPEVGESEARESEATATDPDEAGEGREEKSAGASREAGDTADDVRADPGGDPGDGNLPDDGVDDAGAGAGDVVGGEVDDAVDDVVGDGTDDDLDDDLALPEPVSAGAGAGRGSGSGDGGP